MRYGFIKVFLSVLFWIRCFDFHGLFITYVSLLFIAATLWLCPHWTICGIRRSCCGGHGSGGVLRFWGAFHCAWSHLCVCVCVFGGGGVRRGVGLRSFLGFGVFGAGSGFRVGWRTSGGVCFLFFGGFLCWRGWGRGWALCYGSVAVRALFWYFLTSWDPKF